MTNKSFFEAFGSTIPAKTIASKGGLSYLSAAAAMALAGRPAAEFVDFGDKPQLDCLNGALVAVDIPLPGAETVQRMWLPVMDQDNNAITADKMNVCDVNNSRQRCLVKAIAAIFGDGMSLYLGCDGDGQKAAKLLGVNPDSNLAEVEPVIAQHKEGGAAYIEWGVAVAACRITDPAFSWGVVQWDGLPYRESLGGVMVDVETVHHGKRQRLGLPLMDSAFNPIPLAKATVFDWNKAVMRALTKCIAFNTGYGLAVYGEEYSLSHAKGGVKVDESAKYAEGKSAKAKAAKPAKSAESAKPVEDAPKAPEAPVEAPVPAETVAAPEAVAAPTPVPAEAPASAPAASSSQADAAARFKAVMQKRRAEQGVAGVIDLFDALAVSTKYTAEEKPVCFGVLVPAAASLVTAAEIGGLVQAVEKHQALQYVAADSRDMVAGKIAAMALSAGCAAGDAELVKAAESLVAAGIATDLADVLRLSKVGNVPAETQDLLVALMDTVVAG